MDPRNWNIRRSLRSKSQASKTGCPNHKSGDRSPGVLSTCDSPELVPDMRKSLIDRLLLPAIVGLTTVLGALILFQRLLNEQRVEVETATKAQTLFVKNKLD